MAKKQTDTKSAKKLKDPQQFIVKGQIRQPDGTTLNKGIVQAYDKDMRSEQLLDEVETKKDGRYKITYTSKQFRHAEKQHADLVVRVYDQKKELLVASPIIFNAQPEEIIDLVIGGGVYKGPSEYEQLVAEIYPLIENVSPVELTEEDIAFLTSETKLKQEHITYLSLANKLADKTKLPAEVFYGFAREGLPTELPALLIQDPNIQRNALKSALRDNIIPLHLKEQLDEILERLKELLVDQAFEEPEEEGKTSVAALLSVALPTKKKQKQFLKRYVAHKGPIKEFWKELREDSEFGNEVKDLQFTLQLGALSRNHLPLVKELHRQQQTGAIHTLKDLAKLDRGDWLALINTSVDGKLIGFPPHIPGKDDGEKIDNYARILTRVVEDSFPTAVIAHQIEKTYEDIPAGKELVTFFHNNPEFEFAATYIPNYLKEDAEHRLRGVENQKALSKELLRMDRVFRLTPRYAEMRVLLDDDLDSAQRVTRKSKARFVKKYAPQFGLRQVKSMYANARRIQGGTLIQWSKYSGRLNQPDIHVLPKAANWQELFGPFNLCECEHCNSVHSPAAYLVDMLAFLKDRHFNEDDKSAKDVLFERRTDIGHIALSCENTNTPLPYVDLVNEILEDAVSSGTAMDVEDRQTLGTVEELAANPEYINREAYDNVLAQQVYPWTMPFDLGIEMGRAYLEHLGVSRYELMQAFQGKGESPQPDQVVIASEYLGLTPVERQIITGNAAEYASWDYWGLEESNNSIPGEDGSFSWIEVLRQGSIFLQRSGLSYKELLDLSTTAFINPHESLTLVFEDPSDPELVVCDPAYLLIHGLDEAILNRIHRFMRLQQKLRWSVEELDIAITALQGTVENINDRLNNDLLIKLACIQQLQTELRIAPVNLLSFWSNIEASLYHQLFLNKAILNPVDADFVLENLEDEDNVESLTDHVSTILAALEINAADLDVLRHATGLEDQEDEDPIRLNLNNLSILYRHRLLARALKLTISDLLTLVTLTDINPFNPEDFESTLLFVEKARKVRDSGFSISDLNYLLQHGDETTANIVITDEEIALILADIQAGLKKIEKEHVVVPDPVGDQTRKQLIQLNWDPDLIERVISTLDNTTIFTANLVNLPEEVTLPIPAEDGQPEGVDKLSHSSGSLKFVGVMSPEVRDYLERFTNVSFQEAVQYIYDRPRRFIALKLRSFQLPPFFSASLPAEQLPPMLAFPRGLRDKILYDNEAQELRCIGAMTFLERRQLHGLDSRERYPQYHEAVDVLYTAPGSFTPDINNQFLTADDIAELFDLLMEPGERFEFVLEKLLRHLITAQSEALILQKLGTALQLDASVSEQLLTRWINSPVDSSKLSITEYMGMAAIERADETLPITREEEDFDACFDTYVHLHKIASFVNGLKFGAQQLEWMFQYMPEDWLDLRELPVRPGDTSLSFSAWESLLEVARLRKLLPARGMELFHLIDLARKNEEHAKEDYLSELNEFFGWSLNDLEYLLGDKEEDVGVLRLTFPDDFLGEKALVYLEVCFRLIKRTGVSAAEIGSWTEPMLSVDVALHIKQAVKAKYELDQWLKIAKPLQDILREKQRCALVEYLVADWGFQSSNELYEYFLIDVEMDPCQLTSRIKQAISSVQLFVQRCLMNLEPEVKASTAFDEKWREWYWMKNYRVWEANLKVFLYPENWIEPELRDDKTPFFKELENDLLQSEISMDSAETAFRNYLEKLDAVARLEICGMYHQQEVDDVGNLAVDILHVFGRSYNEAPDYYYRQRVDSAYWTPWEKMDADIEGDHLIPVVWNRRLYVFWPMFTEEAAARTDREVLGNVPPKKYWKIQLTWSEYKNNKWLPKSISAKYMSSPVFPPLEEFQLGGEYGGRYKDPTNRDLADISEGTYQYQDEVTIDKQFGTLIDNRNITKSCFSFSAQNTPNGGLAVLCFMRHVFCERDPGTEHVERVSGEDNLSLIGSFTFTGCNEENRAEQVSGFPTYAFNGMHREGMMLVENRAGYSNGILYTPHPLLQTSPDALLGKTPGLFKLQIAPSPFYYSQKDFFYQDEKKTFFISPVEVHIEDTDLELLPLTPPFEEYEYFPDPSDIYSPNEPWNYEPTFRLDDFSDKWDRPEYVSRPQLIPTHYSIYNIRSGRSGYYRFAGNSPSSTALNIGYYSSPEGAGYSIPQSGYGMSGIAGRSAVGTYGECDSEVRYQFDIYYHPHLCEFIRQLNRDGIDGIMQRPLQMLSQGLNDHVDERDWHAFATAMARENIPYESVEVPDILRSGFSSEGVKLTPSARIVRKANARGRWLITDSTKSYAVIKDESENKLYFYQNLFEDIYEPEEPVHDQYPRENVDFSYGGSYSQYNWELFFHMPLLIADRLRQNQRFEDAQKWFHYIFDPTDTSDHEEPQKFWQMLHFFETSAEDYQQQQIQKLLRLMDSGGSDPELNRQLEQWRQNPFQPHLIARLRTVAYQKTVVMKYIDNLIAWGDQLFRRDTMESINEATQLYILSAKILGPRPETISPPDSQEVRGTQTFNDLEGSLDESINEFENLSGLFNVCRALPPHDIHPPPRFASLYFCISKNENLLEYWDTVEDRLFKIRHCMNIKGIVRQLPLFAPPIDPGLLVKATAAGVDISSVLNDLYTAVPNYRFNVMIQKATELCNDLKGLGVALLSALEKKDAEKLALTRAAQEANLLDSIEEVKEKQVNEAKENRETLKKARQVAVTRYKHYQTLLGNNTTTPEEGSNIREYTFSNNFSLVDESGLKITSRESNELKNLEDGNEKQKNAVRREGLAKTFHSIPNFSFPAAPVGVGVSTSFGGSNIGSAISASAEKIRWEATDYSYKATRASRMNTAVLREMEFGLQSNLASEEIMHIDQQLVAAEIREAIAQKELDNHRKQIENARQIEEFIKDKYTNQELYNWMLGQISGIYFQAYQLAYDIAKRAEKAYRLELGLEDSNFIQFGYWDSLKKGLLAGEKLHHDIKRMDVAYIDQNKREFELTKHVSLAQLHPEALLMLRETGGCYFNLPEAIFDLDHAGHYMRRIKSVSLSIPCVTGPYTNVSCTLTLQSNRIRKTTRLNSDNPDSVYAWTDINDERFTYNVSGIQSIATSKAQSDSGLFELNFRDERYLPFEGAGVISNWSLDLPKEFRQFDYDTISDVVITVHYTAREGGAAFGEKVESDMKTALDNMLLEESRERGLFQLISAKQDFSNELYQFLHSPIGSEEQPMSLQLTHKYFPYLMQDKEIHIKNIRLFLKSKPGYEDYDNEYPLAISLLPISEEEIKRLVTLPETELGGLPQASWDYGDEGMKLSEDGEEWIITACKTDPMEETTSCLGCSLVVEDEIDAETYYRLDADQIDDIGILIHYSVK